jgi:hypothetical protein
LRLLGAFLREVPEFPNGMWNLGASMRPAGFYVTIQKKHTR